MEGLEEGLHRLGKGARAQDVQGVCGLYGGFTKTDSLPNNRGHL
jgi:hypothetical protein